MPDPQTAVNKNRMALLLIAGIPVIIILAATWLWYYVSSGRIDLVSVLGSANHGQLLDPPIALEQLALVGVDGVAFDPTAGERPLWRILVSGNTECDADCQQILYYTRQIHTAMGKYQNRIERVYVAATEPGNPSTEELATGYPGLKVLYTAAPAARALQTGPGEKAPAYFVVDPAGWIILSYAADADGKDIMADLKFLLKNSSS